MRNQVRAAISIALVCVISFAARAEDEKRQKQEGQKPEERVEQRHREGEREKQENRELKVRRENAEKERRASKEAQAERRDRPAGGPPAELHEAHRRLHHLRVAIDNLHAAGLHEPAEHLAREAQKIEGHSREVQARFERQMRESQGHPEQPGGPPGREMMPLREQAERMQAEIGQLRRELNELREQVKQLKK